MAGLTGYMGITMGLDQMLMSAEWRMKTGILMAAKEAGAAGQKAAEHTIDTTESSLSPGKPDRNWTFNMRNSLNNSVTNSGDVISIQVGWLDNQEDYFLIQEHGGDVDGLTVTPMNALMAGHTAILETLARNGVKVS